MLNTREYHLAELDIAQALGDPRRVLPEIPGTCSRILDVGCGAGQSLIALKIPPDVVATGIDPDADAIRVGHELDASLQLVCGSGETLPFQDRSFDFVFSRVALPYMNIPFALLEMARVLTPGGGLWLSLHSLSMTLEDFGDALRLLRPKGVLFRSYVLLNGAFFHVAGKMIRWPFSGGRFESFQTSSGMGRALRKAGFAEVEIRRGHHFVVAAKKAGHGSPG